MSEYNCSKCGKSTHTSELKSVVEKGLECVVCFDCYYSTPDEIAEMESWRK